MIDLKHVEAFHYIVRLGSFSAAARYLHTTQPGISARIRELENTLGVKLFQTESRRAFLTPKGSEFVRYAEELLGLVKRVTANMSNAADVPTHIRLGAVETIAITWLETFFERARTEFPNLFLEIDISLTGDLWKKYRNGSLDMIIVPAPIMDNKVTCVKLGKINCKWMAGPKFELPSEKLDARDLAALPLISLTSDSALFQLADHWFGENGVIPNWTNFCSSMSMVASLIKSGMGVSLLPTGLTGSYIEEAKLKILPVEPPDFPLSFFTIFDAFAPSPMLGEIAKLTADCSTFTTDG